MEDNNNDKIQILDKTLSKGFTAIPRTILRDPSLSRNAKCLYALLLDYAWQTGSCFPGQQRLCEDLGISENTLRKDLNELKYRKLISWKQRGYSKTNIYYILEISPSKIEVHEPQKSAGHDAQDSAVLDPQKTADIIEEDNRPSSNKRSVNTVNASFNQLTPEKLAAKYKDYDNLNFYISLFRRIEDEEEYKFSDLRQAIKFTDEQISSRRNSGKPPLSNPAGFMVRNLKEAQKSRVRREEMLARTQELIQSHTLP